MTHSNWSLQEMFSASIVSALYYLWSEAVDSQK